MGIIEQCELCMSLFSKKKRQILTLTWINWVYFSLLSLPLFILHARNSHIQAEGKEKCQKSTLMYNLLPSLERHLHFPATSHTKFRSSPSSSSSSSLPIRKNNCNWRQSQEAIWLISQLSGERGNEAKRRGKRTKLTISCILDAMDDGHRRIGRTIAFMHKMYHE